MIHAEINNEANSIDMEISGDLPTILTELEGLIKGIGAISVERNLVKPDGDKNAGETVTMLISEYVNSGLTDIEKGLKVFSDGREE